MRTQRTAIAFTAPARGGVKRHSNNASGITTQSIRCGTCAAQSGDPCTITGFGAAAGRGATTKKVGEVMVGYHQSRIRLAQRERNKML